MYLYFATVHPPQFTMFLESSCGRPLTDGEDEHIMSYWRRDATNSVRQIIPRTSAGDTPHDPLRGVVVDNHSIAPKNRLSRREVQKMVPLTVSLSSIDSRTWKSGGVNQSLWNDMCTYGYGVNPPDLCLEFCETHEQDYFVISLVAHFPCIEL